MGEHDASRISYIFHQINTYNFADCLFQVKAALAIDSVQIIELSILCKFLHLDCLKNSHQINIYEYFV